jgi:uncharacterized protein YkwD
MTLADLLSGMRGFSSPYRRLLAVAIVGVMIVVGTHSAVAIGIQSAADEQALLLADATDALEQERVDHYLDALDALQPIGAELVAAATSWATSGSPLLTAVDVSSLQSTADAVRGSLARTPPTHATSADLKALFEAQSAVIGGARERLAGFAAAAVAVATTHLDAAPIADSSTRQAVSDAVAALTTAVEKDDSIVEPFASLTTAVAAVDESQAAAVAAAEAAAAAAAARHGRVAPRPGEPTCSSDVLTCVNQIRAFYGLGSLSSNGTLNAAAQACAQRMHDANDMTHSSPTPGFGWWGENIAHGYGSQVSVFNAWMNSPGHRANILRPQFTYMGFGYVGDGNWWCQQFGS